MGKQEYGEYLASPEWSALKRAVWERSRKVCERCGLFALDAVRHRTFENIYSEREEDLIGVCKSCFDVLNGIEVIDPLKCNTFIYDVELAEYGYELCAIGEEFTGADFSEARGLNPAYYYRMILSGFFQEVTAGSLLFLLYTYNFAPRDHVIIFSQIAKDPENYRCRYAIYSNLKMTDFTKPDVTFLGSHLVQARLVAAEHRFHDRWPDGEEYELDFE